MTANVGERHTTEKENTNFYQNRSIFYNLINITDDFFLMLCPMMRRKEILGGDSGSSKVQICQ